MKKNHEDTLAVSYAQNLLFLEVTASIVHITSDGSTFGSVNRVKLRVTLAQKAYRWWNISEFLTSPLVVICPARYDASTQIRRILEMRT